jgi:rfaE bifunctional protein nucleotidyltransferase chain/domain
LRNISDKAQTIEKILPLDILAKEVSRLKGSDKKVVMCHGVFDLLHIGHIRHFENAKQNGDVLVVTLTPDQFVNKGTNRPAFTGSLRAEALAALDVVDYVAINKWPTAVETLRLIHPDVYCKGGEYRRDQVDAESNMQPELTLAESLGIRVEFTGGLVSSSSQLINRHLSPFSAETDNWLEGFRQRYSVEEMVDYIEKICSLKVLVIGEPIIDEYVFCNSIGKSTKDPVLACKHISTEAFAGGSLAVANHLADFCDVSLIGFLGEFERREDFIRGELASNIKAHFITKHGAPTIHKRRFVDLYSQSKLLEVYIMDDHPLAIEDNRSLLEEIDKVVSDYDVVIAVDYGHGMLLDSSIDLLCNKANFLAVNTQSNAGNRGFNPISKYRRADYVCLANHEIEIETRMRDGDIGDLLMEVSRRIDCENFTVTLGKKGSLHYNTESGFSEVPAFATNIVDRVGAGDAVLALTSLLVSQKVPWDVVGLVGNVAGAELVAELGNRVPINKISLVKHIVSLIK